MDALNLVVSAIGWTLIHSIWLGALAAVAYAIPAARLRISAPQSAYAWGLGCLLALVAGLSLVFAHEFDRVRDSANTQAIAAAYAALPVASSTTTAGVSAETHTSLAALIEPTLPALVLLWALAVLTIGSGLVRSQLALRRLVTAGVSLPQMALPVADLARHFGVSRPIAVISSMIARAPFVIGHFSPVIVLPVTVVTGMPWPQLRLILAHEIAHLRRADYLVNWLQIALEVLLFFHPAVRWLSEEMRRLREACCDDMVVEFAGGRSDYTRALLSLAEYRQDAPVLAPSAVAGGLLWRVQRIAGRVPSDRSAFEKIVLPAVFLSLIATVLAGGMQIRPGAGPRDLSLPMADFRGDTGLVVDIATSVTEWSAQLPRLVTPLATPTVPSSPLGSVQTPAAALPSPGLIAPVTPVSAGAEVDQSSIASPSLTPTSVLVTPAPAPELRPLHAVRPHFPPRTRVASGTLTVDFSYALDGAGGVIDIEAIAPPADAAPFVEAARRALAAWRYDPEAALQLGATRLRHRFVFRDQSVGDTAVGDCSMLPGTRICLVDVRPPRTENLTTVGAPGRRCQATTGSRLCRR